MGLTAGSCDTLKNRFWPAKINAAVRCTDLTTLQCLPIVSHHAHAACPSQEQKQGDSRASKRKTLGGDDITKDGGRHAGERHAGGRDGHHLQEKCTAPVKILASRPTNKGLLCRKASVPAALVIDILLQPKGENAEVYTGQSASLSAAVRPHQIKGDQVISAGVQVEGDEGLCGLNLFTQDVQPAKSGVCLQSRPPELSLC